MVISQNAYIIIAVSCIVLASIAIIIYNTHMLLKNVEEFTDCNEAYCQLTTSNAKKTKALSRQLEGSSQQFSKYHCFKDVKENVPLKLLGCVNQTSGALLEALLEASLELDCHITYQTFYSASIYNVYEKITDDLSKTLLKLTEELLIDPIYAIVYQDNIDCIDDDANKLTELIIIYPRYSLNNGKLTICDKKNEPVHRFQKCMNKYVDNNISTCKGTIYQLNRVHKMFYGLMQKKGYHML